MHKSSPIRRFALALVLAGALSGAAAAVEAPYTMANCDGFVCIRENSTGTWVYRSQIPVSMLPPQDQQLLKAGVPLRSRADFTSAAEDFCS